MRSFFNQLDFRGLGLHKLQQDSLENHKVVDFSVGAMTSFGDDDDSLGVDKDYCCPSITSCFWMLISGFGVGCLNIDAGKWDDLHFLDVC